jgi:hypothetical protein
MQKNGLEFFAEVPIGILRRQVRPEILSYNPEGLFFSFTSGRVPEI